MRTFLITYDLIKPEKNYARLFETIKSIAHGWWHNLDSTWLIGHPGPATAIRNALTSNGLDPNDKVLVIEVTRDWASFNLPATATDWLKKAVAA